MEQLFDVFKLDKQGNPKFMMRAPMSTIVNVLSLKKEAVDRINKETEQQDAACTIYKNNLGMIYNVIKASRPLDAERELNLY